MSSSQNSRVLTHLKRGRAIDPLTAQNKYGVMRLASRINDLRNIGHNILSIRKIVRNRYGDECRICIYKLIEQRAA